MQLWLDMQAHLGGMGGRRRRHHVLQSQQQEYHLWQLCLWQDHVWRGGGDERVLGVGGFDAEVDGEAGGVD